MKQKDDIELLYSSITNAQVLLLEDYNIISNFFNYEITNPHFYELGESDYINAHTKKQEQIRQNLISLMEHSYVKTYHFDTLLYKIINQSLEYNRIVSAVVDIQRQRGFKDYGVEGQMRSVIHDIEKRSEFDREDVLMLRRHEKDFIIRKDVEYVAKLHQRAEDISLKIMSNRRLSLQQKEELVSLLNTYVFYFDQLVELENQLGLKNTNSIKNKLQFRANQLLQMFTSAKKITNARERQLISQMHKTMFCIITVIVFISVCLSFWLSKRVTWRLSLLSNVMQQFVESNFEQHPDNLPLDDKRDETSTLIANYRTMYSKMILLIYDFKRSVQDRVQEIEHQKVRIEVQTEEITSQRDELYRQNQYIEEQRVLVEKQNHEILDSIRYAAGIQTALMPDSNTVYDVFPEHFIFYEPLGIVSGDFYWINQIVKNDEKYSIMIASDCTGHGVPGALMSMLGISYLNELIIRQQMTCPDDILRHLQQNVIAAMERKIQAHRIVDGMEIGIVVINESKQKLQFAGANRSLYIVRNNNLMLLQSDKRPIGESFTLERSFTIHTLDLETDDCLYLFTDGFSDQFGGVHNKKFTKRSLVNLLHANSSLTMQRQREIIENTFNTWRGRYAQIDDVLVMGVRWRNV